jgi:energy-coupling factor transporter ATP-binding protein EcfA2
MLEPFAKMPVKPRFSIQITNYGCVQSMELPIGGIHALIGPNDSGKSTVLRAVRTLMQFAGGSFSGGVGPEMKPFPPRFSVGAKSTLDVRGKGYAYRLEWDGRDLTEYVTVNGPSVSQGRGGWNLLGAAHGTVLPGEKQTLADILRPAGFVRMNADALRRPSALIPDTETIRLYGPSSHGLAGIYDRIFNQSAEDYLRIQDDLRQKFPHVRKLLLSNVDGPRKAIAAELTDGTRVPAHTLSEGLLHYLAFAALACLERPSVLLVEEPENGLHPARIAEVIGILRDYSKETPVLLATHSPLVINELKGDEVSVLTRSPNGGTQRTLLKDTPNFETRSEVYAPGELWVSYADGDLEKPLFQDPIEPEDPGAPLDLGDPG